MGTGADDCKVDGGGEEQAVQTVIVEVCTMVDTVGTTEVMVEPDDTVVRVALQEVSVVYTISVVTIWEVSYVVTGGGGGGGEPLVGRTLVVGG